MAASPCHQRNFNITSNLTYLNSLNLFVNIIQLWKKISFSLKVE